MSCQPKKTELESDTFESEDQELPVEKRSEKILYDEIIELHDEVMLKMNEVMSLKGQLQEKVDLARDAGTSEEAIEKLTSTIGKLEQADESMMQWMRNFKQKDDETPHEQVIKYYTDQKEQMEEVKNNMNEAMKNANAQLKDEK